MRININNLSAKNFGSYKSLDIDFLEGIHCIVGTNLASETETDNGSGKSTILDALYYGLYGESLKNRDPSRNYKGDCKVEVTYSDENTRYKIVRCHQDKDLGSDLFLYQEDEDITERTKTGTQELINKSLGVDKALFTNIVGILQGNSLNYCNLTPTSRKTLLEEVVGQSWDSLATAIKKNLKKEKVNLERDSHFLDEKTKKITNLKIKVESSNLADDQIKETLKDKIKTLKEEIKGISGYSLFKEESNILKDKEKELIITENKISNLVSDIKTKQEYVKVKKCHTCSQPLPVEIVDKSLEDVVKLKDMVRELKSSTCDLKDEIEKSKDRKDKFSIFENKTVELNKVLREFKNVLDAKMEVSTEDEEELKNLMLEVENIEIEIDTNKKDFSNLEYLNDILKPSSDFRTSVISRYVEILNQELFTVSPILLDNTIVQFTISDSGKGVDIVISKDTVLRDIRSFSGGEKAKINLVIMLSIQKVFTELSGSTINIVFLDEIFDGIDRAGMDGLLDLLTEHYNTDLCCFVITHNKSLKNNFTSTLEAVKNEDGVSILNKENYIENN